MQALGGGKSVEERTNTSKLPTPAGTNSSASGQTDFTFVLRLRKYFLYSM